MKVGFVVEQIAVLLHERVRMKAALQGRHDHGRINWNAVSRLTLAMLLALAIGSATATAFDDGLNWVAESEGVTIGPPEVHFPGLPKEKAANGTFFVDVPGQEKWEVRNLRCDSDHMEMKQREATAEEKKSRDESTTLMAVDFSWNPERKFNQRVDAKIKFDVAVVENGKEKVLPREVLVAIGTASRMTISGPITNQNQILMDVVKSSRGKKLFFSVKVRDEEKRLSIKSFQSTVKCLKLHLEPQKDWEKNGLYKLILEIPKNSEPEWHMSTEDYGVVDIVFDHPRIKPAQFLVQVAVVDED